MDPKDFTSDSAGRCMKTLSGYWAFMPNPLPPKFEISSELINTLSRAQRLLGELSGTGRVLQNPYLLISPYTRREAISSSKIEGTLSTLSELYYFEALDEREEKSDVREVHNFVRAMDSGINLLHKLPISTRLICKLHKTLMRGVRGEHGTPGEYRTTQNWIGPPGCTLDEATFVPPPVHEMSMAMNDWEKYVNSELPDPILIQAAIMHYQFEAIHPFIDGNGRIGRTLITLFLYQKNALSQPLLYLSEFFERHRNEYYNKLLGVSQKGNWTDWFNFFLNAIIVQTETALKDSKNILAYYEDCMKKIKSSKKVPEAIYKVLDSLFITPVVSISRASRKLHVDYNPAKSAVLRLEKLGILKEVTGRKRNKVYTAPELMKIISSDIRK